MFCSHLRSPGNHCQSLIWTSAPENSGQKPHRTKSSTSLTRGQTTNLASLGSQHKVSPCLCVIVFLKKDWQNKILIQFCLVHYQYQDKCKLLSKANKTNVSHSNTGCPTINRRCCFRIRDKRSKIIQFCFL